MDLIPASLPVDGPHVIAGGLIGMFVQGAVFILVAWLKSRGRITEAKIEADDKANARLAAMLTERLEICEHQLANCHDLLRVAREDAEKFRWHAQNCDRQLLEMKAEIAVLQRTVQHLLAATPQAE